MLKYLIEDFLKIAGYNVTKETLMLSKENLVKVFEGYMNVKLTKLGFDERLEVFKDRFECLGFKVYNCEQLEQFLRYISEEI